MKKLLLFVGLLLVAVALTCWIRYGGGDARPVVVKDAEALGRAIRRNRAHFGQPSVVEEVIDLLDNLEAGRANLDAAELNMDRADELLETSKLRLREVNIEFSDLDPANGSVQIASSVPGEAPVETTEDIGSTEELAQMSNSYSRAAALARRQSGAAAAPGATAAGIPCSRARRSSWPRKAGRSRISCSTSRGTL